MSRNTFLATLLTIGGVLYLTSGFAAADTIKGKVLGGGQPITNSTVTLWAASAGAPRQLGQARTGADGSFTLNSTGGGQRCHALSDREGRPTQSQCARW